MKNWSYKEKYHQTLDSMYELFKYGRKIELDLENRVDQLEDELKRIRVICNGYNLKDSHKISEIKGVLDRVKI